ncbi:syntaxin-124-like protein [Tanacetum coccineum]
MNDLFSQSFKQYQDNDLEAGNGGGGNDSPELEKFFQDVENVKEDMAGIEKIYKRLQEANEESKTVHNANAVKKLRSKMDSDVEQVLKRVRVIKGKIEALDKANIANRKLPGCGPGSSADRTRTSVVSGLGKKLKSMMDNFQSLRTRMNDEYKETVARRYFTITGEKANDELIENLISNGEGEDFMQKAIQDQGRGQIMDTISEIQERHDSVKEIEKNLMELHQIFLDMAALVEAQGQQLNDIESHVSHASSFVHRGTEQLVEARELQKNSRKCTMIALMLVILLIIVLKKVLLESLKKVQLQFFRYLEDQDHLHFSLCDGTETEDKTLARASVQHGKNPGARSGLRRKQSSKHKSESKTEASKYKTDQSDQKNQSSSSKPTASTLVVDEMHKEEQQAAGPPSLRLLAFFTLQCDVSEDSTTEADPRISAPRDSIPQQQGTNEESRSDEISKIIKLDDLSNLMRDVRSHFIDTDSLEDEPIIVTDESEEEEAERYEDTHATSHNEP